ncbi:MAG: DUF3786 domain-containing protein [Verrucomicrobia bacterium]|jgi:hypothetical protein|nr:DUF3786 domain-containing protein [Verrucomicrobiota bacterium]MBT7065231.1 DUF3786 domain-containing protein [Verrucomicrobiota bacterium]MBT7700606.1 DUF3786 domain-containing protein [Verrucomicrobiota bacterium]
MNAGEVHAWELLQARPTEDVVVRTGASFCPATHVYRTELLSHPVEVALNEREIRAAAPAAEPLLAGLGYFARRAILGFLVHGHPAEVSGRLVRPGELPGVDAMVRGSHTLPLDKLAARYDGDLDAFTKRGEALGGVVQTYGDASLRLHPFATLPLVLILWSGDDEFAARGDLLLDATAHSQVPVEVLWCAMMLTVLAML